METKQLNTEIPTTLDKDLAYYCIRNSMKKKEVVEKALIMFLSNEPKQEANIEN